MTIIRPLTLFLCLLLPVISGYAADDQSKSNINKSVEQDDKLESHMLHPYRVEEIPVNDFEHTWLKVGLTLGYPNMQFPDASSDAFKLTWINESWLKEDLGQWDKYNNRMRFFISGFMAKRTKDGQVKPTPEEFKSSTLGYYQCANTVVNVATTARNKGMNISGTINDVFKMCTIGRTVGSYSK